VKLNDNDDDIIIPVLFHPMQWRYWLANSLLTNLLLLYANVLFCWAVAQPGGVTP